MLPDTKPQELSPDEQEKLDNYLIDAAREGYTFDVEISLAMGADVHATNDWALCCAAYWGHTKTVQVLAAHIFAPDSWRGKKRTEIEAQADALYGRIKSTSLMSPIKPERLREAATILLDCALNCWEQVRPAPRPLNISARLAQPMPL